MEPVSSRPSNTLFHWTKWPPGKGRGGWCPGESRERGREAGETGTWRARSQIRTMFHRRFSDASLPVFSQGHTWSCVDGQNIGGRINTHTHTRTDGRCSSHVAGRHLWYFSHDKNVGLHGFLVIKTARLPHHVQSSDGTTSMQRAAAAA